MSDIDVSRTLLLVREFGAYVLALPGIGTRRDRDDVAVALLAAVEAAAREDCRAAIEAFVERVNKRAEAEMLRTGTLEGAHHRGIEAELAMLTDSTEHEFCADEFHRCHDGGGPGQAHRYG